ncbi:MAG: hypothetical protein AAF211_21685, partial [Myxococcota bacterium]
MPRFLIGCLVMVGCGPGGELGPDDPDLPTGDTSGLDGAPVALEQALQNLGVDTTRTERLAGRMGTRSRDAERSRRAERGVVRRKRGAVRREPLRPRGVD